ncbi:hypothetical protein MtrunA17_Chr7g0267781 [Medicago truncatula]|nr:hypothetical protein MtrunA17_Chr7g0267781 [Medicago truncatula]
MTNKYENNHTRYYSVRSVHSVLAGGGCTTNVDRRTTGEASVLFMMLNYCHLLRLVILHNLLKRKVITDPSGTSCAICGASM